MSKPKETKTLLNPFCIKFKQSPIFSTIMIDLSFKSSNNALEPWGTYAG